METQLHSLERPREAPGDIQRAVASDYDLSDVEQAEAQRLDRLVADAELVERLMWRGYTGSDWEKFRRALAEYGFQVVLAWSLSGRIFRECKVKGFGGLPGPPRKIDRDDASELAGETVARSLDYFREHVLVPRCWDPTRGASIKTFFIGTCIFGFSDVYRGWVKENRRLPRCDEMASDQFSANDATTASVAESILTKLGAGDREILELDALGYTQSEIAELVGRTRKAIENRLPRIRKLVRAIQ